MFLPFPCCFLFSFLGCSKSVAALQDSLKKSAHSELALFALYWFVVTFPCGIVHILVMIRLRVAYGGRRVGQAPPSHQIRQKSALDETADALQSSPFFSLVPSLFSLLLSCVSSSLLSLHSCLVLSSLVSFIFSCPKQAYSSRLVKKPIHPSCSTLQEHGTTLKSTSSKDAPAPGHREPSAAPTLKPSHPPARHRCEVGTGTEATRRPALAGRPVNDAELH